MKSRRILTHNELVGETMAQLKFPFEVRTPETSGSSMTLAHHRLIRMVQITWLKRVLEALISSGYMARTTRADQAAYEYLP